MLKYVIKHLVAAGIIVGGALLLTVVTYVALLLWALFTNAPLGGPLALPFWFLTALAAAVAAVLAVLGPVTTASEIVCRNRHRLLQIPVALLFLFLEMIALGMIWAYHGKQLVIHGVTYGAIAGGMLLVPLGIYWGVLQATDWILEKLVLFWRRLLHRTKEAIREQ